MIKMEQYMSLLLNSRRENEKDKFPCSHNDACCGICNNFYPCLFDLLRKIKQCAINNLNKTLKDEGLKK
jgi:hypothetical protein